MTQALALVALLVAIAALAVGLNLSSDRVGQSEKPLSLEFVLTLIHEPLEAGLEEARAYALDSDARHFKAAREFAICANSVSNQLWTSFAGSAPMSEREWHDALNKCRDDAVKDMIEAWPER